VTAFGFNANEADEFETVYESNPEEVSFSCYNKKSDELIIYKIYHEKNPELLYTQKLLYTGNRIPNGLGVYANENNPYSKKSYSTKLP
jgi:hypothetical protein